MISSSLSYLIDDWHNVSLSGYIPTNVSLRLSNLLGYIKTTLNNNIKEIPLCLTGNTTSNTNDHIVIAPLIAWKTVRECRNINTVIDYMKGSGVVTLKHIKFKDELYYATKGLLLDSDLNPIILSTITIDSNDSISRTDYISPNVYLYNNNLSKAIRTKIMPYIATDLNSCVRLSDSYNDVKYLPVNITIGNEKFKDFLMFPKIENYMSFDTTCKYLNDLLKSSINCYNNEEFIGKSK